MSLTAVEMKRLENDARPIATDNCRGYLADALQCLRDTGDPIASLELLRAMWGSSHARRRSQKLALDDAGQWLDRRLRREPGIAAEQLAFELGWLRRLVTIHCVADDNDDEHGAPVREPSFGAYIDQLRQSRKRALAQQLAGSEPASRSKVRGSAPLPVVSPERLPDSFEVCFASWQDAVAAFRKARERRKAQKPIKERLLPVQPVQAELQPLATNLVWSMCETQGMDELLARAARNSGQLPSFWISGGDVVERDGKRVVQRIVFERA